MLVEIIGRQRGGGGGGGGRERKSEREREREREIEIEIDREREKVLPERLVYILHPPLSFLDACSWVLVVCQPVCGVLCSVGVWADSWLKESKVRQAAFGGVFVESVFQDVVLVD